MRVALLAALAAASLYPASASADVVYRSGSGTPGHIVSLSNEFANGKHLADDFSLASPTRLDAFVFTALTNGNTRPVQFANLEIYADTGTGPHALIYSAALAIAGTTDVGAAPVAGFRMIDYAVNLGQTLAAGNYFVSLNVGPDQPDLYWAIINDPANPGNNWESTAAGGPYTPHVQENLFRFEGAAVAAPAPEPVSWALMVGGFGAVGGAMRRKRRPMAHA